MQMTSMSGDFAEWHQQIDPSEKLFEGAVVGFCEGKIGLNTTGATIFGIISDRAVVAGSTDQRKGTTGAMVAYCGEPATVLVPQSTCIVDWISAHDRN